MATILTSETLDSAARTAGEIFYIGNSSTIFTIDTDTRYHRNAPASGTGSLGGLSIDNGQIFVDGTKVRWLAYTGGSGNVPAYNTSIVGNTSGATGALLGVYSAVNVAPTAVGAAMPATGFIKLKSASTAYNASETLTGLTATTNGTDKVGWLEIAQDTNTLIDIRGQSTFKTRSSWFDLGTTSGTAGQVVQLPTCGGGTDTYYAGVWIETGTSTGVYEFYPAQKYAASSGSGWYNTAKGTDSRSKFVEMQTGGAIRIGQNSSGTYGYTPPSGRKIRIPNLLFVESNSSARASNIAPNTTLEFRPTFDTSAYSGNVDIQGGMFGFYFRFINARDVILKNTAVIDSSLYLELLGAAFVLEDFHNGNYLTSGESPALFNSSRLGGTVTSCKFGIAGTSGTSIYVGYSDNITFTDCTFGNTIFRTYSPTTYAIYNYYCNDLTFIRPKIVGQSMRISTCNNTYIEDLIYADSYSTTTSTSNYHNGIIQNVNGSTNTTIKGLSWFDNIENIHPYYSILYCESSGNTKFIQVGTSTSKLSCGSSNQTRYIFYDGGDNSGLEFKRLFFSNVYTSFALYNDYHSNTLLIQNCSANTTNTFSMIANNQIVKGLESSTTWELSDKAQYGSIFGNFFSSTTEGTVNIFYREPTDVYSNYIDKSNMTSDSYFFGQGLSLAQNDSIIYTFPYTIKGYTSITGYYNYGVIYSSWEYQIDTGSGYSAWKTMNNTNLQSETISSTDGFNIKFRITATINVETLNFQFYLTMATTSTAQYELYPLDTIDLTITGLQTGSDVVIYQAGTTTIRQEFNEVSGTTATYTYEASESVDIGVFKAGYVPLYVRGFTLPTSDSSLPIAQVVDRAYLQ